jgi:serine/threonine protein kinase
MNNWIYKGNIIQDLNDFPEGTYGFIYEVRHIPTGRKYIGKKVLFFERTKMLGKKEFTLLSEERKKSKLKGRTPIKRKILSESDWRTYYGSNQEIKALIKEGKESEFEREILTTVYTKKLLTYYECKELFIRGALESSEYFNGDILGKFHRQDFN